MVRISKLTDYGVMIMTFLAQAKGTRYQAREIAQYTTISTPTVSKLLKLLVRHKLLASHRGIHGGYHLNIAPERISVRDLIHIFEGPIALTECNLKHPTCKTEAFCGIRAPWQYINQIITRTLDSVKLSDLANTSHFHTVTNPFHAINNHFHTFSIAAAVGETQT